jgi:hypothetical protein
VRREDIKASFDKVKPSEADKSRMLNNIIDRSYGKKDNIMASFRFKKLIPALAMLVVIAGGILTYNMVWGNDHAQPLPGYIADGDLVREDAVAPIINMFRIDDRHYIMMSDDLRAEFGFPAAISESDIGDKLADIKDSPDKSLIGCEVYRYTPASGEAVVVVKKDGAYVLFNFFVFESYNNNQDEDAARYLEVYGFTKPEDIVKIRFIGHSEESKILNRTDVLGEITDRDEIARFYDYYSKLKNSSDKYFEKLFGTAGNDSGPIDVEIDPAHPNAKGQSQVDPIAPDAPVSTSAGGSDNVEAPDHKGYAEDMPLEKPEDDDNADDTTSAIIKREIEMSSGDTPTTKGEAMPADSVTSGMVDMGQTEGATSVAGVVPARDALANPITIRIYHKSGVYIDTVYYPAIGFISRYEISRDFAEFMDNYIK